MAKAPSISMLDCGVALVVETATCRGFALALDAPTCRGGAIAIGAAPFRGVLFAVEATACCDVVFAVEAATCRGAGLDIVLVAFACREMFGLGGTTTPDFLYFRGQATLLGCLGQLSSRRANELLVVFMQRRECLIMIQDWSP